MPTWLNADGLYIKYGAEEAEVAIGGELSPANDLYEQTFTLAYTEFDSATPSIPHTADGLGIIIPKGAKIKEIELVTLTAFTSSGTIGSSTYVMGLKKLDRSTELDHDGLTAAGFTHTVAATLGTIGGKVVISGATTGAGAFITTQTGLTESGIFVMSNSAHASHPHTAGNVKITIRYYY